MRNPNSGDAIDFLFPGESNTSLQYDLEKSQSCHTFLIYDCGLVINCISESGILASPRGAPICAISPKPLSSKYPFGLVNIIQIQYIL